MSNPCERLPGSRRGRVRRSRRYHEDPNASSYVLSACILLGCGSTGGEFDSTDAETAEQDLSANVGLCPDATPDLSWHNGITGENQVWCMTANGAARASVFILHESHVVWHHGETGQAAIWFMNRDMKTRESAAGIGRRLSTPVGVGWSVVGGPDMNRDGWADLLWHNPGTGQSTVFVG